MNVAGLPRPRAILFDWDNTLVDNWETIRLALNTALTAIIKDPAVAPEMTKRGFVPTAGGSPEQLAAFVKTEIDRWGKVVRTAGAAGIE